MSWTRTESAYDAFAAQASNAPAAIALPPWALNVWEITEGKSRTPSLKSPLTPEDFPQGRFHSSRSARCLTSKASLRIVFAPLDLPRRETLPQMLELFHVLHIPGDFTTERTQSVCHSFGDRTDEHGSCSWFHFLQKNIDVKHNGSNGPEVDNLAARMGYHHSTLPQADYSWHRSGFFLRVHDSGAVTLVCFGETPMLEKRLGQFIASKAWEDVATSPYILFDVVIDGLYFEADNTVWNLGQVFGPLEHLVLEYANTKGGRNMGSKIPFAALHNCAKHIIHIAESLESCIMVVDAILARVEAQTAHLASSTKREVQVVHQLGDCLQYRRSLFRSSQLRLSSLQKRIDNAITLSFNLVTQQDSMVMIQDSNSMKIIAAITMIFLPTTGVATVIGSQLLVSELDRADDTWKVLATPLFWLMWKVAIPLTVFVAILAGVWHWWTHNESPHRHVVAVVKRTTTFGSASRKQT